MGRIGDMKRAAVGAHEDSRTADYGIEKADRSTDQGNGFRSGDSGKDRLDKSPFGGGAGHDHPPSRPGAPQVGKPGEAVGRPALEPVAPPRMKK